MRFFGSPTSPFARKVSVLIREAAILGIEELHAGGSPLDPGTIPLDVNPLGKIPALELPDGTAIYDSRVICRYLDSVHGAGLYPAEPLLWDTLTLEATADGMLEAALLMVYETRIRPEALRFDPWVQGQWSKIDRALDMLETRWHPHLQGPLDMGQVAVACALGYLDFRHSARRWREGRPHLAAWEAVIAERPAMVATRPVA